ncbi:MAG TPA: fused MFS/spermidine synthase [Vicinamibacterales bacterium]|nr:fused MFS/spermidine synthase [Vicinamibacterales bacterium]
MRLAILLLLFFGSGVCGLIYQVLWLRLLALVFGVTVYAASTVLAAFMAGLATGSVIADRVVARVRRPLVVFGVAEILIGVSALITPVALDAATGLYARLYPLTGGSLPVLTAARLLTGFVVLLVPTILMGMTLPVLSASTLVRGSSFGRRVSALYAVNTAGAVTGAVLTGFYLIGAIGMQNSFLLGASINVAVGVVALVLAGRVDEMAPAASTLPETLSSRARPSWTPSPPVIAAVVGISGLVALALEIVWFRTLVQYLTATTYAFTTMLATVLAGIAIGGGLAARLLRTPRDWAAALSLIQMAASLLVLASAIFLGRTYEAGWRTGGEWQASAAAILPVAVLMGLAFPIALHLATAAERRDAPAVLARRVGRLYAVNVVGAILGALLGGFLLLPLLGARRALIVMGALYGASALLLVWGHPARPRLLGVAGVSAVAFGFLAVEVPDPFAAASARRHGQDLREFWREEGVQTAVSVHASQFRRSLYMDGLHQANDTPEMVRLHRIIGHLPMVLHPAPHEALVIGLGGGATPGAVSQYPGTSVQVVELSESVRKAASFFAHVNYDVLNQPNVRIRVDDGRNFLTLSGETFDVITADIIQPVHAGAGNLYSREYFSLVRDALEDNGLALQWIGHREPSQYALIMRTFLDVFPHATLWFDGNLMLGSIHPLHLDPATIRLKRANPVIAQALDDVGLTSWDVLASWYTAGPDAMRQFVGAGPLLTDDRPLVEYHRSLPRSDRPLDLSALRSDFSEVVQ